MKRPERADASRKRLADAFGRLADNIDPTERLRAITEAREALDHLEARAAREGHRMGWSWGELGRAVGISRQAARERWRGLVE